MVAHPLDTSGYPICLGRQPILDREQRIVAYELLFRSSCSHNAAVITDDFAATAEVVVRAFADFGLSGVLGDCLGYINVDERFLSSDLVELLPRERVVLEVLETVEMTPAVLTRLHELKAMGFGWRWTIYPLSQYIPALALVDIVKRGCVVVGERELAPQSSSCATGRSNCWPRKLTTTPSSSSVPGWDSICSRVIFSPSRPF